MNQALIAVIRTQQETMLAEAVSKEDYEKASEVRDEINRRSR